MIDCECPKPKKDCCVPHITPSKSSPCPRHNPCHKPIPACYCDPCGSPAVLFKTTTIPEELGTSEPGQPYAPKNGMYRNMLVRYEADGAVVLYDSGGIYTPITSLVLSVNGKTGKVVLTTEDIENVSGYINADEAQALIDAGIATVTEDLATETEARIQGDATLQQEIDDIKNSPDVVDIVATYADLQAYDTSSLGDKDVIRVLRDEAHGGASTYYRWGAATSSFTYIGEVGDYYTKDQTDALLSNKVDKVAGKGLSENDFTDADKAKLDGIESGAEVNTIDSVSVNGTQVTPDANKNVDLGIPDSAFIGTDGTIAGVMGLVPAPAITDAGKFLKADGTWDDAGTPINVVQTTGTSTTNVMSQNAVTSMVYADPSNRRKVSIGGNAMGMDSMVIGYGASASGDRSTGLGTLSLASGLGSVALAYSEARSQGEFAIGIRQGYGFNTIGYNGSAYRLLTGVYDPQSDHDAATKGYVDGLVGDVESALNVINNGGN